MQKCRNKGCGKLAKNRGYCTNCAAMLYQRTSDGTSNGPKPKLTAEQVTEIKRRYARFETKHSIAKLFGVRADTITSALSGNYVPKVDDSQQSQGV